MADGFNLKPTVPRESRSIHLALIWPAGHGAGRYSLAMNNSITISAAESRLDLQQPDVPAQTGSAATDDVLRPFKGILIGALLGSATWALLLVAAAMIW